MLFWIIVAGLAALTASILALAALRRRPGEEPAASYDLRVYRDQLNEVDRDLARGLISETDAERVRTEISRRILAADAQLQQERSETRSTPMVLGLIALVTVSLVGGSLWLYTAIGQPGYGDMPRALREARAAEARASRPTQAEAEAAAPAMPPPMNIGEDYKALVERLRETVAERPDDLDGHILLARNEAALGNYVAAYEAQAEVIRIRGDEATGRDYLNYADMMILAAGGYISPEAEAQLAEALDRQPTNGAAQYYWGLLHLQTGRPDIAFRIWQRLLRAGPPDAPWIEPIRAQIENVAALAGETNFTLPPAEGAAPGPTAGDMQAASDMTPEERQAMIEGMVEGLAARLASDGGTADEWARLIRALAVLGDTARAQAIWGEAQEVFAADDRSMAIVAAAAADAGLTE